MLPQVSFQLYARNLMWQLRTKRAGLSPPFLFLTAAFNTALTVAHNVGGQHAALLVDAVQLLPFAKVAFNMLAYCRLFFLALPGNGEGACKVVAYGQAGFDRAQLFNLFALSPGIGLERQRHNGHSGLFSQLDADGVELLRIKLARAGVLRKHNDGNALFQAFQPAVQHGCEVFARIGAPNYDGVARAHYRAKKRHGGEAFFDHKGHLAARPDHGGKHECFERAHVVGHK